MSEIARVIIDASHGAWKTLRFRLRRKGTRDNWDVSGASRISLEVNRIGEPGMTPLDFSPSALGADWTNGLVIGELSPADVTGRVGSYEILLLAYTGTKPYPVLGGRIEVQRRPVFAPFGLPNGVTVLSEELLLGKNEGLVPILPGAPIARTITGIVLATGANPSPLHADGVAVAAIDPGNSGLYMTRGTLLREDWTDIVGTEDLVPAENYYLGLDAGTMTLDTPAQPDYGLLQVIGESIDARALDINIGGYEIDL